MKRIIKYLYLLVAILFLSLAAHSQTTAAIDDSDLQSWDDVSLTVAVNKKIDLYFPVTFRFDENISQLHEGRVGAGVVLKPHKRFAFTPYYTFIKFRNTAGVFKTENRVSLRAVYRFPTVRFGLSHRSLYEYRSRSTGNFWWYRASVTIDKELPKKFVPGLKIYATEEPFYESLSGRFSRNRLSFGINKIINPKLSVDIYYLRQDSNFSHPAVVHVIGTSWKIKI